MSAALSNLFGFMLTWWGIYVLAALDTSIFFFVPFGNDAAIVYLVARDPHRLWLYPLMATAGSATGGALTYWIGARAGEAGLPRLASTRRLDRLKRKVKHAGPLAMALPAAMPPPFPLTAFMLTCGALEVNFRELMVAFAGARLVRFGVEALLARRYGTGVLQMFRSDAFEHVIVGFIVVAIAGTAWSLATLWRRTRHPGRSLARRSA